MPYIFFSTFFIGIVSGIVSLSAILLYARSILNGKTKPSRVTWWAWTLVGLIILSSYYHAGAEHSNTIWLAVSYVAGPFFIALLSFKYGVGGWSFLDRLCFFGVAASILVWYMFGPLYTLFVALVIDCLGALPTIRKVYARHGDEDKTAWLFALVASSLNLFAIDTWTFSISIYPVYMFLLNGTIVFFLYRQRKLSI